MADDITSVLNSYVTGGSSVSRETSPAADDAPPRAPLSPLGRALEVFRVPGAAVGAIARDVQAGKGLGGPNLARLGAALTPDVRKGLIGSPSSFYDKAEGALNDYYATDRPNLTALQKGGGALGTAADAALHHPFLTGAATFGAELLNPLNLATGEVLGAGLRGARVALPAVDRALSAGERVASRATTPIANAVGSVTNKFHGVSKASPLGEDWARAADYQVQSAPHAAAREAVNTIFGHVDPNEKNPLKRAFDAATGGLTREQKIEILRRTERDADGNMVNVPRAAPDPKHGPSLQARADAYFQDVIKPLTQRQVAAIPGFDARHGFIPMKMYQGRPVYGFQDAETAASAKGAWPRAGFGVTRSKSKVLEGSLDDLEARAKQNGQELFSPDFDPAFQLYNYVRNAELNIARADAVKALGATPTTGALPARVDLPFHLPNRPDLPVGVGPAGAKTASNFADRQARENLTIRFAKEAAAAARAAGDVKKAALYDRIAQTGNMRSLRALGPAFAKMLEARRNAKVAGTALPTIRAAGTAAVAAADPATAMGRFAAGLGKAQDARTAAADNLRANLGADASTVADIAANAGRPTSARLDGLLAKIAPTYRAGMAPDAADVEAVRAAASIAAGRQLTKDEASSILREATTDYQGIAARVRDPNFAQTQFKADLRQRRQNAAQEAARAIRIGSPGKTVQNGVTALAEAGTPQIGRATSLLNRDLQRNQENVLKSVVRAEGGSERVATRLAARQQALTDQYFDAKTSAAARDDITRRVAAAHTSEVQRILSLMGGRAPEGYVPESDLRLGLGDESHGRAIQKDFATYLTDAQKAGALPEDAEGIAQALATLNGLARRMMILVPTVHTVWNLGMGFLSAGGRPQEMVQALAGRIGEDYLPPDLEQRFMDSGAASALHSGSTIGTVRNATTPIAEMNPLSANNPREFFDKASSAIHKFGDATVTGPDSRYVFDVVENGYARVLFKRLTQQGLSDGQAAARIRRVLGDYTNITQAEKPLQSVFFFYPWMKTAISHWSKELANTPGPFFNAPMQGIRAANELQGDDDDGRVPRNPFSLTVGRTPEGDFRRLALPFPQRYANDVLGVVLGNGDTKANELYQRTEPITDLVRGHFNPVAGTLADAILPGSSKYQRIDIDTKSPTPPALQIAQATAQRFVPPVQNVAENLRDPLGVVASEAGLGFPSAHLSTAERERRTIITREYGRAINAARAAGDEPEAKRLYFEMQAAINDRSQSQ